MYFAGFMDFAGEFKNTFGRRRFTRIYVREYADVPVQAKVCHDYLL
jgi:hypothetical protein